MSDTYYSASLWISKSVGLAFVSKTKGSREGIGDRDLTYPPICGISSVVEHRFYTASVGSSILSPATIYALVAELVDALVLGTSGKPWEFESLQAHHYAPISQLVEDVDSKSSLVSVRI